MDQLLSDERREDNLAADFLIKEKAKMENIDKEYEWKGLKILTKDNYGEQGRN